jgi:hypothetical protein
MGEKFISIGINNYSKAYKLYNSYAPRNLLSVVMLFLMKLNFGHGAMMVLDIIFL